MMLSEPTPDLDRLIERMDARLQALLEAGDRRAHFLLMYRTFKHELRRNLQAGRFLDRAWSEAICCRMAEMYFESDTAYEQQREDYPEPWRMCFDGALQGRTNLLQDMLLGMNAHVNYDLPLSTYQTLLRFHDLDGGSGPSRPPEGVDVDFDPVLRGRYRDFLLINQVAWESLELIQDAACRRFSKLLAALTKAERLTHLRLSRRLTETVICDYRDRAWGHTVLLATSTTEQEREAVRRYSSDFAMKAGALVAALDPRPARFLRAFRQIRRPLNKNVNHEAIVRMLVHHLGEHATVDVARRALIESGPEVHPILVELLDTDAGDVALCGQILKVLAANPSATTGAALSRQLGPAGAPVFEPLLHLLVAWRRDGLQFAFDGAAAASARRGALRQFQWTANCYQALGDWAGTSLIGSALRDDARRLGMITLLLSACLEADWALMEAADSLQRGGSAEALAVFADVIRRLLPGLREETVERLLSLLSDEHGRSSGPINPPKSLRREERLGVLARAQAPWLRACALFEIGSRRVASLAPLVHAALDAPSPLVADTACWAAEALSEPSGDRPARQPAFTADNAIPVLDSQRYPFRSTDSENTVLSIIEKVLSLKHIDLFVNIPAEDLAVIARAAQERRFRSGHRLIEEGEPGDALYVILDGQVDVVVRGGARILQVGPGAVLGEMGLLLDAPCSATCIAQSNGRALRIRRSDFQVYLVNFPGIAISLLRVLAERIRQTDAVIEQRALPSVAVALSPTPWQTLSRL
ncbi:MAG: DUF5995 family protein [Dehalococcoidia bacterium]